ncbi:MAG: NusG domain II-containing protein [Clostridia bacterium]|nr:NusG domain II-containing protein [Clostridia bacterium]
MKRIDLAVIVLVLVFSAAVYFLAKEESDSVSVYSDGELFGEYPLSEDTVIDINGTNTLVIFDGKAYMSEADCPDKLCMKQGKIGENGGSIICLPNRVTVETGNNADAVSR